MTTLSQFEVTRLFLTGGFRSSTGEGKKDKTIVKREMEAILPIKNFMNHNSIGSGFDFDFGEFIVVKIKIAR
ncbi:MAG: hypothetical protein AUK48_10845 [Oscillatoriales cyanobacterium CG2_30_44_21]|nr:MAG: hypothetical protein AUK48_10845 [Oscillatoriales cyanobacterium CG2_30_44_21]